MQLFYIKKQLHLYVKEISVTISIHSVVPKGSTIGVLLLIIFVNNLPDALEALTLLFADGIKAVTRRA